MSERRAAFAVFLFLAVAHCVAYEPGVEVALAVGGAPPSVGFETDRGELVTLDEAVLFVADLELEPCAEEALTLRDLHLGSVARAHGEPTGNGPWRLDLAVGGSFDERVRPRPGTYCALVLHLDGAAFESEAAPGMRVSAAVGGEPVHADVEGPVDLTIPFETPLELFEPGPAPALAVTIDQRTFFDGGPELPPWPARLERATSVRITR